MTHTHTTTISSSSDNHYQEFNPNSIQPASSRVTRSHRVNWHEAAACAIEIELRDFSEILQFLSEFILGKNSYRIDLLVIKKLSGLPVPKNIARIFKTYNLFEFKGIHASMTISSYYKTIGYAGLFIDQTSGTETCTSLDVSISFLTFRHPRKLMKHLQEERHLTVEKSSPGIYYVSKETFEIQIIVTRELPPGENLYLRCLTDQLANSALLNRLVNDYSDHSGQKIYVRYLKHLINANTKTKGESQMLICEELLNLFGTSSEEIMAKAKTESDEYYLPKINEMSASIEELTAQNNYLKKLLQQNNISFD